jgi:hypothetical protein
LSVVGLACVVTVASLAGCAPTPGGSASGPKVAPVTGGERGRAVKAGDVATGAGTLEGVRRQLEGKWDLVSLATVDATGRTNPVPATGHMTYDAYGNLDLDIEITDPAALKSLGAQTGSLDLKGRAVIDAAQGTLRVQAVTPASGTAAPDNIERVRFYEFQGNALKLTAKDAAGKTTGISTWKRAS